jgi:hypothetical protein
MFRPPFAKLNWNSFIYLKIPITLKNSCNAEWQQTINKLEKKITRWGGNVVEPSNKKYPDPIHPLNHPYLPIFSSPSFNQSFPSIGSCPPQISLGGRQRQRTSFSSSKLKYDQISHGKWWPKHKRSKINEYCTQGKNSLEIEIQRKRLVEDGATHQIFWTK